MVGLGKAQPASSGSPFPSWPVSTWYLGPRVPDSPPIVKGLNIPSLTWGFTPIPIFQKGKLRPHPPDLTLASSHRMSLPSHHVPLSPSLSPQRPGIMIHFSELETEAHWPWCNPMTGLFLISLEAPPIPGTVPDYLMYPIYSPFSTLS